jgi:hypothetical protein
VRDAFSDLLALARRDESWGIILTCRDYSIDVVRSSFLEHGGLPHAVVSIPQLTDEELNEAVDAFPKLRRPATNAVLRKLFYNPYLIKPPECSGRRTNYCHRTSEVSAGKSGVNWCVKIITTCMRCRSDASRRSSRSPCGEPEP